MLWIMSQDKTDLVNVIRVFVNQLNKCELCGLDNTCIDINPDDDISVTLAEYATKERAKEVVSEIFGLLRRAVDNAPVTYEMPLK